MVLGSGRGQIKKNDIYRNQEAGVYVLYGGNPTIRYNLNSVALLHFTEIILWFI